jgi:hypothetical protein
MSHAEHSPSAWSLLERYYHACAFFHGREVEYHFLSPYVKEGPDKGEKALHITDPRYRDGHLDRLALAGITVQECTQSGQLELRSWTESYLRDDRFDPDAALAVLDQALRSDRAQDFQQTRIIGHMEWALEDRPGVHRLLEYEARVNDVLAHHRESAVCVYDLTRFGAETVVDVLRTHPLVILGGIMRENPFFEPPAQFLQTLQERGT